MTANELFIIVAQVSGLAGIVGSMLAMGLGLTLSQIIQPLKNVRLVVPALLANFVLIPLLAYGISLIIPLEGSLKIGLMILAAPFLVLEAQGAKANLALAVELMKPLMVSAAIVVTLKNFADTNALPFVLVASILIPLILLPTARWLGQRAVVVQPVDILG